MSVVAEVVRPLDWEAVNLWEREWWSNCTNTFNEERKQFVYAKRMGLRVQTFGKKSQVGLLTNDRKILDIGGGPISLLLKCDKVRGKVVDPCTYPTWVYQRYEAAGIAYEIKMGEDIDETGYDEVWIYNCLQHVREPEKILHNARRAARMLRIFEWTDTPVSDGHPHTLTRLMLDKALGMNGTAEIVREEGCVGRCYYGVFVYP